LKRYSTNFLHEQNIGLKLQQSIEKKISVASKTTIGKELGMTASSSPEELPITNYDFYKPYFEEPHEGDFMYPLRDYVNVSTSGTMGKPKTFLLPESGLRDNMRKTGFTSIWIYSHDGEESRFEAGDVVYTNVPGGSHLAAYNARIGAKQNTGLVSQCPDPDLPFQRKVDHFVENVEDIAMAYMTVTTLIDEVYPRIGEPFYLKGFMTQDSSAGVLKEEIKKITGNYPKVTYGSTETLASTLASIQHPGCFFFDWRVIYPEFIPEDNQIPFDVPLVKEPSETTPMMDVKVGARYQLIATLFKTDITRYAMPDILECVSKGDDILGVEAPMFKYYSRADNLIVLHNFTRIAEDELVQVLMEAEIPFVDFTARKELDGARDHMAMYIELLTPMSEEEAYRRIYEKMMDYDKDWRDLTNFLKYAPLKLRILNRGTFNKYLRSKPGMPRINRIGMREERLQELLRFSAAS
jgi:hypothetical protein